MNATAGQNENFESLIDSVKGCFSAQQAVYLRDLAAKTGYGWIVEVGSYRGKSAVALWTGAKSRALKTEPAVYCVEPHATFRGIYGGEFGPEDRKAFYENMIRTGAYEGVALLNQSSETIAPGWTLPIGLLIIDGDHSYEGVKRDFEAWHRHVVPGGRIIFDDAADPEIGPYHLIREILEEGGYAIETEKEKLVTLRKNFVDAAPPQFSQNQSLNILVACSRLAARGGYLRFERIAESLRPQGHSLTFATLFDDDDDSWQRNSPVINLSEAFSRQWDVTMIPGEAGFACPGTRSILDAMRSETFGLRVQHCLNDKSRREKFQIVNASFRPHLVLFNNDDWKPGDYTQFQANQFQHLAGAVDVDLFSNVSLRDLPQTGKKIWIGAQSQKHPELLVSIVENLPAIFCMRIFGPEEPMEQVGDSLIESGRLELSGTIHGEALRDFYDSVDIVLSVESQAGWANVGAEALASGTPLICTRPGTSSFAIDGETALIVDQLDANEFVNRIEELTSNPELAHRLRTNGRRRISEFDWDKYSQSLLTFCYGAREAEYFLAPHLNLYGKWPLDVRLNGLQSFLETCSGKTILDLGAAEGAIALSCLTSGAKLVHGFELDRDRVTRAKQLCKAHPTNTEFRAANLDHWNKFLATNEDVLLNQYDVVCYLGLHHHLNPETRNDHLDAILRLAKETFVIRTPHETFEQDQLDQKILAHGFVPVDEIGDDSRTTAGGVKIYRRAKHACHFVSFPKSGRTWLRYALHEMRVADTIEFHHDQFEFNTQEKPPHDFSVDERKSKYDSSHRIVYLERNPLDVMASFYHQITGRFKDYHNYQRTPSEFIRDPYFGAHVLHGFRKMWNELAKQDHVLKVTYEACHEDLGATLGEIVTHLDLEVDGEHLIAAADASGLDSMRKVESDGKFPHPWLRPRNGASKVRNGKVGGHKELFSPADIAYLSAVFSEKEIRKAS
ncbi:class I SAM-dependent methyltransferase [Planctomycetota bacterium]